MAGPLSNYRVLDLSRVLAGPWVGQTLADLGAEVIKVERPGSGDETRAWGPPWLKNEAGEDVGESAYYLSANRGKKSIALDIASPEGRQAVRDLAAESDVLLENYKVGGLAKYGLDYESLKEVNPGLIYCSITGFGQDGPYANRAGYDFVIQGLGGFMSITGDADGEPMRAGVAVADLFTGMYATVAVTSALLHRERGGGGQHIDMALLDCQVAALANQASNYHISGEPPGLMGNAHPNVVPYQVVPTTDGHIILAIGNDRQFAAFCKLAGRPELAADERFRSNAARIVNRERPNADHLRYRRRENQRRLAGYAGGGRRALRRGQRYRGGLRRRPGPASRHADRTGPPAGRQGAPDRKPDALFRDARWNTGLRRRFWASIPVRYCASYWGATRKRSRI